MDFVRIELGVVDKCSIFLTKKRNISNDISGLGQKYGTYIVQLGPLWSIGLELASHLNDFVGVDILDNSFYIVEVEFYLRNSLRQLGDLDLNIVAHTGLVEL